MGTNFYSVSKDLFYSTNYERSNDPMCLHIGKSSMGWCFALHVIPDHGICDITGWVPYFFDDDRVIIDEYNKEISFEEMYSIIAKRSFSSERSNEMYKKNDAIQGPHNLARSKIGDDCIGHGEGTWDLIKGNFS